MKDPIIKSRGFMVLLGQPDASYKVVTGTGLPETGSAFRLRLVDADDDGMLVLRGRLDPEEYYQCNIGNHKINRIHYDT